MIVWTMKTGTSIVKFSLRVLFVALLQVVCVDVAAGAELHGGGLPVLLPHVWAGEGASREHPV